MPEPLVPESITGKELDKKVRSELRTLSKDSSEAVSRHLVAAAVVIDEDPKKAYEHTKFALRLAGRVSAVREAHGVAAYRLGQYSEAIKEFRTTIRLSNDYSTLPLIADSERGLGRPERALDIFDSDEMRHLGETDKVEMTIIASGARADLGELDAAELTLQIPALRQKVSGQWQPRLWLAYSDALSANGKEDEARKWLTLAADVDKDGQTDAAVRLGRPAPQPPDEPWESDERIELIDAYDPDVDENAREQVSDDGPDASGTDSSDTARRGAAAPRDADARDTVSNDADDYPPAAGAASSDERERPRPRVFGMEAPARSADKRPGTPSAAEGNTDDS